MRSILRTLKEIWFINLFRRLFRAIKYFNYRYIQILKWGFNSREDTNFTYDLTSTNRGYLAHMIAVVTDKSATEVSSYFSEIENDEGVRKTILDAIENSREKYFADKEVRFGRRLGWYAFIRIMRPKIVIETGIDKGLGAVLICAALLKNKEEGFEGRYFGTDINPQAGYFLKDKYKEVGTVLYGDSIESLSKFDQPIDLFINDSDHSEDYEYQEYLTIQSLIHDETVLLGDNSHCTSKLADFSSKTDRRFLFFQEVPQDHWYPGAGIGISFKKINGNIN